MRLTVVDTLSTIFFFTILAAVTELYVAGMEHAKVLKIRAVMIPMMILTGRPYGAWRSERPWSETRGPMIGGPRSAFLRLSCSGLGTVIRATSPLT